MSFTSRKKAVALAVAALSPLAGACSSTGKITADTQSNRTSTSTTLPFDATVSSKLTCTIPPDVSVGGPSGTVIATYSEGSPVRVEWTNLTMAPDVLSQEQIQKTDITNGVATLQLGDSLAFFDSSAAKGVQGNFPQRLGVNFLEQEENSEGALEGMTVQSFSQNTEQVGAITTTNVDATIYSDADGKYTLGEVIGEAPKSGEPSDAWTATLFDPLGNPITDENTNQEIVSRIARRSVPQGEFPVGIENSSASCSGMVVGI